MSLATVFINISYVCLTLYYIWSRIYKLSNPVKVEATGEAFKKAFNTNIEIVAEAVESNVSDQPMSSEEAPKGAFS